MAEYKQDRSATQHDVRSSRGFRGFENPHWGPSIAPQGSGVSQAGRTCMGTEMRGCSSGGVRKKFAALGVALAIVGLCVGKSIAGDLSALPAQVLNVTGATSSVVPVTAAQAQTATPEAGCPQGFHLSGFLSQSIR